MWLPLVRPLLGTWPTTQACALTGNQTGDPLVRRPTLNPLSYSSQGLLEDFWIAQTSYGKSDFLLHRSTRLNPVLPLLSSFVYLVI